MANAKVEDGEDQSMEEILQSIRNIIAEENDDATEEEVPAVDEEKPTKKVTDKPAEEDSEEVLELTDSVQEDGSVVNVADDDGGDVLDSIDDALDDEPEEVAASEPEPEPEPEVAPEPKAEPKPAPKKAEADDEDGLLSDASVAASAEALKALKAPVKLGEMPFVSGDTVEGLVQAMLRPMLKDWLDTNLPTIVKQAVDREVKRITSNMDE